jgi:hypothetical protein
MSTYAPLTRQTVTVFLSRDDLSKNNCRTLSGQPFDGLEGLVGG